MKLHEAIGLELERREKCASRQHCEKAELQARIEALEAAARVIVNENTHKQFSHDCGYKTVFANYDRVRDAIDALAALLDSEPSAHTCSASCQRPACVLRRRVEELEAERRYYRAMIAVVHREYIGFTDPEPQDDQQAIDMIGEEWASELPRPPEQEGE